MTRTLPFAVGVLAAFTISNPAWAHAHLKSSSPSDGAIIESSPARIGLQFTEDLEPSFSGVTLLSTGGEEVPLTKTVQGDGASVVRVPARALVSGSYDVHWHVLSKDGHATSGSYSFVVKP